MHRQLIGNSSRQYVEYWHVSDATRECMGNLVNPVFCGMEPSRPPMLGPLYISRTYVRQIDGSVVGACGESADGMSSAYYRLTDLSDSTDEFRKKF